MSLEGLNAQQRAAAREGPEGPVLVNAGPGSGKTKVLTERIAWLVQEQGVSPGNILAMTFSVKAAEEMRVRNIMLLRKSGEHVRIGTFHKICRDILTEIPAQDLSPWKPGIEFIKSDRKRLDVVEAAMREVEPGRHQFPENGKEVLKGISFARNWMIPPEHFLERPDNPWDVAPDLVDLVARCYLLYQQRMQTLNAMDFDDQLMQTALLFRHKPALRERYGRRFQYVLVDEFQDLNHAQYCLTQLLGQRGNIFVVGDEDQTIYSWRGADAQNFAKFRHYYPNLSEYVLRRNYRSKPTILGPSQQVVQNNPQRSDKGLFTQRRAGKPVHVEETADEVGEAEFIAATIRERRERQEWSDYAILYRNNVQCEALKAALERARIPCQIADDETALLRYVEIRDMLAFLRLCVDPDDRVSFQRVINVPRRGIGPVTLDAFFAWLQDDGLRIGEALMTLLNGAEPQQLTKHRRGLFLDFARLLYRDWRILVAQDRITTLFDGIREQVAYDEYIDRYSGSTDEGESPRARDRKRNLNLLRDELERAERGGRTLKQYLETSGLARALRDKGNDAVSLMTLHTAKGLEFPVVFITGLEEGLLPDSRAAEVPARLEEERRLFYVGMTRAEDELYLTWAARRRERSNNRSRFLRELENGKADTGDTGSR